MIKLYRLDDLITDEWLFSYDREHIAKHEHAETTLHEGYFLTDSELEQLKREYFEAGVSMGWLSKEKPYSPTAWFNSYKASKKDSHE